MRIPFVTPRLGAPEVRAVVRALRNGWIGGNGQVCREVQTRLEELTGARHALLTPSATQAMEVYLLAAGIGPGDEVVMPSFAFVSQANAILARGATPVFCEIDPHTLNLDPADVEARVTERTRAVLPVHYAGIACDLDALGELAERRGLRVLEDAAQALGARWRGRQLGTVGHAGFLSFHSTKNLVCGEGGALLTDDDELFRAAEIVQEKGTNRTAFLRGEIDKYTWVGPGGSYVLSDLLAALLGAQLERLDALTAARVRVWEAYHEGLADEERRGLLRRPVVPDGVEHNGHIYALRLPDAAARQRLIDGLRERGVSATFHFQPLHASPYAGEKLGLDPRSLPHTLEAADTLVRLPVHDRLRRRHVEYVLRAVRAALGA
ncbi:MAG: dTDP-4-amino-4,6-dideoxygalactose transaminase [Planctomycetota bacterium]